jgi:hypothetical protein
MLSATLNASFGIIMEFSCAAAVFFVCGPEHEKDRNAREKPKIAPIKTKLNMKKCLDESFLIKFIRKSSFNFFDIYISNN